MVSGSSTAKDKRTDSYLSSSSLPTSSNIMEEPDLKINSNKTIISQLDIADGLKELLLHHDLSLDSILNTSSTDLARILNIDQQVAEIIVISAKKQIKMLERMR